MDTYEIYCQWQRERGLPEPTREWWAMACSCHSFKHKRSYGEIADSIALDNAEIERNNRVEWPES